MRNVIILILAVTLGSLVLAHINKPDQIDSAGPDISYQYLSNRGYLVVEYLGSTTEKFDSKHMKSHDVMTLALMNDDYEKFLDEEIEIDTYFVTNHPLDNDIERLRKIVFSGFKRYYPNKTQVFVGRYNGEIIGGFSMDYYIGESVVASRKRDIDGNLLNESIE